MGRTIGLDGGDTPEEGARAEKVDYGRSKYYGQAAYGIGMFAHRSLQLFSLPSLITVIKYIHFILSDVLTS